MTDQSPGERSLSSACGNVTVAFEPMTTPRIELADTTSRMAPRDLAELITETARAAADAVREADPGAEDGASLDEAVAALTELRDDFRDAGSEAAVAKHRQRIVPEDVRDDAPKLPDPPGAPEAEPKRPAAHQIVVDRLTASLELLERFRDAPPGSQKGDKEAMPVGEAKNDEKTVHIESTLEYPVASVRLGKRALERGPKALAAEINATAEAAAADLRSKQGAYFAGLGMPGDPGALMNEFEEVKGRGEAAVDHVRAVQDLHHDMTTKLMRGGYFA